MFINKHWILMNWKDKVKWNRNIYIFNDMWWMRKVKCIWFKNEDARVI